MELGIYIAIQTWRSFLIDWNIHENITEAHFFMWLIDVAFWQYVETTYHDSERDWIAGAFCVGYFGSPSLLGWIQISAVHETLKSNEILNAYIVMYFNTKVIIIISFWKHVLLHYYLTWQVLSFDLILPRHPIVLPLYFWSLMFKPTLQ